MSTAVMSASPLYEFGDLLYKVSTIGFPSSVNIPRIPYLLVNIASVREITSSFPLSRPGLSLVGVSSSDRGPAEGRPGGLLVEARGPRVLGQVRILVFVRGWLDYFADFSRPTGKTPLGGSGGSRLGFAWASREYFRVGHRGEMCRA